MTLIDAIHSYKQYELLAHVELDDVIIKVSEELLEMLEAKAQPDALELKKEMADTVANILSASAEVGCIPDEGRLTTKAEVSDSELLMGMKHWIQDLQSVRNRYSRRQISQEALTASTEEFLSLVLSYGGSQQSLEEILAYVGKKFSQRIEDYKPDLDLKSFIAEYPDFPKAPVLFRDVSPLLMSPEAMQYLCFELAAKAQ